MPIVHLAAPRLFNHRSDGTTTSLVSSSPDLIPGVPDPVTYTVDITTLFKTDPTVRLGQQVEFVTGGAECVVDLAVGEDYLIGLYWDSDGLLRVASCGLYRRWETVQEGEVTLLASGCSEEDPCSGTCGDGQVSGESFFSFMLFFLMRTHALTTAVLTRVQLNWIRN